MHVADTKVATVPHLLDHLVKVAYDLHNVGVEHTNANRYPEAAPLFFAAIQTNRVRAQERSHAQTVRETLDEQEHEGWNF